MTKPTEVHAAGLPTSPLEVSQPEHSKNSNRTTLLRTHDQRCFSFLAIQNVLDILSIMSSRINYESLIMYYSQGPKMASITRAFPISADSITVHLCGRRSRTSFPSAEQHDRSLTSLRPNIKATEKLTTALAQMNRNYLRVHLPGSQSK